MSFRNYFIKSNPSDYCYAISAYYAMVSASNKLPKLDGFRYVINEFAGEDIKDICEVFHHHKGKSDPLTIIKAANDIIDAGYDQTEDVEDISLLSILFKEIFFVQFSSILGSEEKGKSFIEFIPRKLLLF